MTAPSDIMQTLEYFQRPIFADLTEAMSLLSLRDPLSIKALALVRWEMMRHLRAYQLYKHGRIFDPIISSSSGAKRQLASDLKGRCLMLALDYQEHVTKWSLHGPATEWDRYVLEAEDICHRIDRHLSTEMQEVGRLLRLIDPDDAA